jgi:ATP-dependent Clp protease protease subunit
MSYLIDTILTNNVDLDRRIILMFGEVNGEMARQVCTQLLALSCKSDKPIKILINSDGGLIEDGYAIYNLISALPNEVEGVVIGSCHSMASIILQACDKRTITPYGSIMLHIGSASIPDNHAMNVEIEAEEMRKERLRTMDIYSKRTGFKRADWSRWIRFNKYFTPAEALKYKLVDRVERMFL